MRDEMRSANDNAGDIEALIANLDRPELLTLSSMLSHSTWRMRIIRWLRKVRPASKVDDA
jgi:hypothetical protein